MNIAPTTLYRAAAVALAAAGVIFILIQPLHPHEDAASVMTGAWVSVHLASMAMAILGLAGITGVYATQASRVGLLGLLGWVVFALFFLTQLAVNFAEAFILPLTAEGLPELTEDIASLFASGYVLQTDVGILAILAPIGAVLYLGGGVLFGVAIIRAALLPRWTGVLLILASVASLSAAILPHDLARYAAVPMGAALVAIGITFLARQRVGSAVPVNS